MMILRNSGLGMCEIDQQLLFTIIKYPSTLGCPFVKVFSFL